MAGFLILVVVLALALVIIVSAVIELIRLALLRLLGEVLVEKGSDRRDDKGGPEEGHEIGHVLEDGGRVGLLQRLLLAGAGQVDALAEEAQGELLDQRRRDDDAFSRQLLLAGQLLSDSRFDTSDA